MSIKYEKRENQMKQQTSFSENVYDDRWHWSKTIIIYLKNKTILTKENKLNNAFILEGKYEKHI